MASGQPVAVMHGANAPLMKIMVAEEMERERQVQAGELERKTIPLEEAVPGNVEANYDIFLSQSLLMNWPRRLACAMRACVRHA